MSYIENKIVNALIIFMLVLFVIFVGLCFIDYQPYILTYGEVVDNYVNIYLEDKEISDLNHKLKYNNEILEYEIIEVSTDYIVHENKLKRNVKINFNFNKNEHILELYIGYGKEINIWENLYKKYMKGVI